MRKFNIVITDNGTGETIYTYNTNAVIAAIEERESITAVNLASCSGGVLADTIVMARLAVDDALEQAPDLRKFVDRVYREKKRQQRREAKERRKTARRRAKK